MSLSFQMFTMLILLSRPFLAVADELEDYLLPMGYSVGELDRYLYKKGYLVTEGYMTIAQKKEFKETLGSYNNIRTIFEIGFNAGHSAEFFLTECPLAKLISVDICYHDYTPVGYEYMREKFKNRSILLKGDSRKVLTKVIQSKKLFDLIFIDGGHSYDVALEDIKNCSYLAHKDTHLWIDDYNGEVQKASESCVEQGLLKIIQVHATNDRPWAEARYLR